ncbi:hypothetical protein Acid7E03_22090 [Acidisoma sp. 7E03]
MALRPYVAPDRARQRLHRWSYQTWALASRRAGTIGNCMERGLLRLAEAGRAAEAALPFVLHPERDAILVSRSGAYCTQTWL